LGSVLSRGGACCHGGKRGGAHCHVGERVVTGGSAWDLIVTRGSVLPRGGARGTIDVGFGNYRLGEPARIYSHSLTFPSLFLQRNTQNTRKSSFSTSVFGFTHHARRAPRSFYTHIYRTPGASLPEMDRAHGRAPLRNKKFIFAFWAPLLLPPVILGTGFRCFPRDFCTAQGFCARACVSICQVAALHLYLCSMISMVTSTIVC